MFGPTATILALVALVGFALAALLYALFYNRIAEQAHMEKRLNSVGAPLASAKATGKKLDAAASARRRSVQDTLKDIELKQKSKAARSTNPPIRLRLQQAGIQAGAGRFYMLSGMAGLAGFIVVLIMQAPFLLALGVGVVCGTGIPRFIVNFKRKRRQKAFTEELPNAVEIIVRGVKAGLPLNDCMRMIAMEAKEPLRAEFKAIIEAQQLGVPMDEAVGKLYERMPLPEANFFAIVIAIQSKAGGNLAEALGNLAKVLRERKKMRAKISAMSAEAKSSAAIIGAMPLVVTALVYMTSPDYIALLWLDPRGQVVVGCSALVMFTGVMVMRKMINFDF
jgi:tight adherence protein B